MSLEIVEFHDFQSVVSQLVVVLNWINAQDAEKGMPNFLYFSKQNTKIWVTFGGGFLELELVKVVVTFSGGKEPSWKKDVSCGKQTTLIDQF